MSARWDALGWVVWLLALGVAALVGVWDVKRKRGRGRGK